MMKTPCVFFSLLMLAACGRQPAEPTGVYRLGTAERTMVLEVRASGDYVLHIDAMNRLSDEIRGRWEGAHDQARRDQPVDASFHGIVWRGQAPEAGAGLWPVSFERDGGICLDGEGQFCFTKDRGV